MDCDCILNVIITCYCIRAPLATVIIITVKETEEKSRGYSVQAIPFLRLASMLSILLSYNVTYSCCKDVVQSSDVHA